MINKIDTSERKDFSGKKHTDYFIAKPQIAVSEDKENYAFAVLDALQSNIAIINSQGTILKVNKAWNSFAEANGDIGYSTMEGANYFEACKAYSIECESSGYNALKGIKEVINGIREEFYLEYPCNAPDEERWFHMRVKKIDAKQGLVLIEHSNISDRKIIQDRLDETATVLEQTVSNHNKILDSSLDLICSFDEDGDFIHINSAAFGILGYEPKELIGTNFSDLVFIDDRERTKLAFLDLQSGVSAIFFENRYYHKKGTLVHLFWSAKWNKVNKTLFCIVRDITDRRNLERAMSVEKQRFMDLYHQTPSCMGILKGPNHVYEMANPLYLRLIGKDDIIGKSVKEVLPELESQAIFKFLDDVYRTGVTFSANEMLIKFDFNGDGNLVDTYLNFIYQAHRNNEGEIDGILFFAIDATEQVLSRRRIEESEKKYRQIVETAQEGIWMIDENNKTTFVNSKMARILGYKPQEMLGKEIFFFMDEKGKKKAVELLKSKKEKYFNQFIFKFLSKSGKVIWNTISANPLFNDDNCYIGALAMVTDITERKKDEEKLQLQNAELIKAHSELDRFVYSVSHDLRSPLTSILGLLSFIEEESREADTLQHADMIRNSISRLDEFIKNILNYSRNNRIKLHIEEVSIEEITTTIVNSLQNIPEAKGIEFQIECHQEAPFYSDNLRLSTILENLISNAIKHHKTNVPHRYIKINTQFKNKKLYLTIADNGLGIEEEFHKKIFEMFYRVSGETDGTGIGLYIVKDAVEKIQGTINVQSEKDVGTVFTILLKNLKP